MDSVDNVLLLRPIRGLDLQSVARAAHGSTVTPPGLLVTTIYQLRETAVGDFPDFFTRELEPALGQSGIALLASYVTEHSPNTFPALPVREGIDVFVWMALFSDERDRARRVADVERSAAWRGGLEDALLQRLDAKPEVLRLTPTARSLLHG
jgi:hypothetical protein